MSQKHLLVWLGLSIVMAEVDDHPYCSDRYERLCAGKGAHVGCQFPYRGPGEACENYTSIIFSDDLKKFILHYINRRRQRIASGHERVRGGARLPKPEIMMLVQWDRELAYLAQRLADQCRFLHDQCRATVRYPYAGQTVGEVRWRRASESMEMGARRTIGRVFDAWWGERRRVQVQQLTTPFILTGRGAVWGHFSQLAVWTLRAIGCGAVHHGAIRPRLLLVCDFSHTNMLGQRTISPGPLAACPMHTKRIRASYYPLLCAPFREPINDPEEIIQAHYSQYSDEDEDSEELERDEAPKKGMPYQPDQVEEIPRERPFRPLPVDIVDLGEGRIVEATTRERTRSFKERTELSVRYRESPSMPIIQDKLNMELELRKELEMKNKAAYKASMKERQMWDREGKDGYISMRGDRQQTSREPYSPVWRETYDVSHEEMNQEILPLRRQTEEGLNRRIVTAEGLYRPTEDTTEIFLRQRWKHTRNRPRRPGAIALLHTPPSRILRKQSKVFITLDQEDQDQLFRDTGFKVLKAT